MMRQTRHLLVVLLLASVARVEAVSPKDCTFVAGDKVILVLQDATFVEGEIVVRTSTTIRVKSLYGARSYNWRDIEQIVERIDYADPDSVKRFEQLPGALKAALNARADYDLGNYERALSRLTPFLDNDESKDVKTSIDWLVIEIYERQGRWEDAKRNLKNKRKNGAPHEQLRAKAHIEIFKWNPDYDLRFIGQEQARNFLVNSYEHLRNRAKEPNSLRQREIMDAALAEYCEQLLVAEDFSVGALERSLRSRKTYESLQKLTPNADVEKHLPYIDMLKSAEESISKAQAVLPGYGSIYELQLLRVEVAHISNVWKNMSNEMLEASPRRITPAFNPQTGRLTRQGREQLVEQCDEFVARAKRVLQVLKYILAKIERYPRKLSTLIGSHQAAVEYHENLVNWARKLRSKKRV